MWRPGDSAAGRPEVEPSSAATLKLLRRSARDGLYSLSRILLAAVVHWPPQMARIHELAAIYGALADATRLRILGLLGAGEVCVRHIHEALRLPQPTVSRHLSHLRHAGLVHTRREGLWVHYRLAELTDPSARAALSAAIHAIGHAPATRADQVRLASRVPRTGKGALLMIAVPPQAAVD